MAIRGQLANVDHLIAVLTGLISARFFLRTDRPRRPVPGEVMNRVHELLATHGGGSLSWMTTWPNTRYLLGSDGYLAYRVHAGVAITVGDPIGSSSWRARAMSEF